MFHDPLRLTLDIRPAYSEDGFSPDGDESHVQRRSSRDGGIEAMYSGVAGGIGARVV